jgi:hypothetical protein
MPAITSSSVSPAPAVIEVLAVSHGDRERLGEICLHHFEQLALYELGIERGSYLPQFCIKLIGIYSVVHKGSL